MGIVCKHPASNILSDSVRHPCFAREAPVDKRAHQDCNKTHAVSTHTNKKFMKTLFGVHAQVSCFFIFFYDFH